MTTQTNTPGMLNPRIVGQAENAHRAVLDRELAGTGVDYEQWVALMLTSAAGAPIDRQRLVGEAAQGLKDPQAADSAVNALIGMNLLNPVAGQSKLLSLTDAGRALVARVSKSTNDILARAYASVPAGDLATTGRVLTTITGQLDQELARK
ncbi:MarR family winged helix-turn-helix transcriptional regulator [Nocardia brevicatena]|uniref:MarR family winged helix-turn-helix transcriptional regulator n=1 Tax=Nocardia brevicatena TaxID=37327 RepID=UPI0002F72F9B|nr:hypothetical protein [Nocardia brevicatena]